MLDDRTKSIPNLSMSGSWAVCTTSACQSESVTGRIRGFMLIVGPQAPLIYTYIEGLTGSLIELFVSVSLFLLVKSI
jgi:hypothetical protein